MPRPRSALWELLGSIECEVKELTKGTFRDLVKNALQDKARIAKVQSSLDEDGLTSFLAYAYCSQCEDCSRMYMFEAKAGASAVQQSQKGSCHEASSSSTKKENAERLSHLQPLQATGGHMFELSFSRGDRFSVFPQAVCPHCEGFFMVRVNIIIILHLIFCNIVILHLILTLPCKKQPNPGQAKAQLISENLKPENCPTMDDIRKAHRRRAAKAQPTKALQPETVKEWEAFLDEKIRKNDSATPAEFQFFRLVQEAGAQHCLLFFP
eukprot:s2850_g8.t1